MMLKKGFTLIETILAIVLMGIITEGLYLQNKRAEMKDNLKREIFFFQQIEDGFKSNFMGIIDYFEESASEIASDASEEWGWRNSATEKTSPFPLFDKEERVLTYNVQYSSLLDENKKAFLQMIKSNLKTVCSEKEVSSDKITFFCPRLVDLTYTYKGNPVSTPHVLGEEIDPEYPPQITVTYDRNQDFHIVPEPAQPYVEFSTEDIYTIARKHGESKMNIVRNGIKKYFNTKQLAEFANSPSEGLNSMDDEIIFWFWQALGDEEDNIQKLCERDEDSGECENFDDAIWRTNVDGKGLLWNRISQNIFNGEIKYSTDGFNNQVIFYPITTSCDTDDYETCSIEIPEVPRDEYTTANVTAPYVSVMFVKGKGDKSIQTPDYARTFISF